MEVVLSKPLHILLAEDSEEDAFFFRHALESSRLNASLSHVLDGQQAIDYLQGKPPFDDRTAHPFPEMIITDLKMPQADGFHLLHWLKECTDCAIIPTLVLSSSYVESDVIRAYQLGVNAFLTKPGSIKELADLLLVTYMFWSRCQRPPPPPNLKCE